MLKVVEYDLSSDMFIVECVNGNQTPIDASALALLLNRFDEPETFIGLTFTVQVQA